jgi:hypothetical protein
MDYITKFINNCVDSGKSSIADISEAAKCRIKEIEHHLQGIEDLKREEKALNSLLKQITGDFQVSSEPEVESVSSYSTLPENIKSICDSIVDLIEDNQNLSVKFIIESVSDLENSRFVLTSLKWLIDNRILSRSESDRKIFKGDLWLEKEQKLSTISFKS